MLSAGRLQSLPRFSLESFGQTAEGVRVAAETTHNTTASAVVCLHELFAEGRWEDVGTACSGSGGLREADSFCT